MSDPYVGEIRLFAGLFTPVGWADCDGELLAVSENDALFSLLGTTWGGDGQTTFGLPDLRGRVPVHAGQGPGLSPRRLGQVGGQEQVTIQADQLPAHGHAAMASNDTDVTTDPGGAVLGHPATNVYRSPLSDPTVTMAAGSTSTVGGGQPHDNVMPFEVIRFMISLYGIYPSPE